MNFDRSASVKELLYLPRFTYYHDDEDKSATVAGLLAILDGSLKYVPNTMPMNKNNPTLLLERNFLAQSSASAMSKVDICLAKCRATIPTEV